MDYFPSQTDNSLETFRTEGEKYFYQQIIQLAPGCTRGLVPVPQPSFDNAKIECYSDFLRLSEKSAPNLHRAMRKALGNLGRQVPYDLFQVQGDENAMAMRFETHPLIALQGRMLSLLDEDALSALLGHELGHCFLHASQKPLTLEHWMFEVLSWSPDVIRRDADAEDVETLRAAISAYLQCRELSADRISLIASHSLDDALRLMMITMTGLSHTDLHWDSEEFLKQAQLYVEDIRQNGFELSTHPSMCMRAWALAQFAQTNRDFDWLPAGSLDQAELDRDIIKIFSKPRSNACEFDDEQPPAEMWIFALSACFLLSWIDGEFSDSEADWLARIFSPHVPDYKRYMNEQTAAKTLSELTPFLCACSISRKIEVFLLLAQVMIADDIIDPHEVDFILMIGQHLECEELWHRLLLKLFPEVAKFDEPDGELDRLDALFDDTEDEDIQDFNAYDDARDAYGDFDGTYGEFDETYGDSGRTYGDFDEADPESERVAMPMSRSTPPKRPSRAPHANRDEATRAFELYCNNIRRRGASRTTTARLLRLIGRSPAELAEALPEISAFFTKAQIDVEPDLNAAIDLQTVLSLTPRHIETAQTQRTDRTADKVAAELISALTKLQATQINGNGHSPAIRCHAERPGKLFDLTRLNQIDHGRAERLLTTLEGDSACVMLSTAEAAQTRSGREISLALEKLAREAKLRQDEQGTSDLCAGSCFISGIAKGYLVRAPLMLHAIELKRIDGAVCGWKACPVKGSGAKVNHAVLRLIANKLGSPYNEAMMERLDDAATKGEEALIQCVTDMAFFIGKRGGHCPDVAENAPGADIENTENTEPADTLPEDTTMTDALYPIGKCTPVTDFSSQNSWLCLESCAMLGIFPQSSSETLNEYNELLAELQTTDRPIRDILGSAEYLMPASLLPETGTPAQAENKTISEQPLPLVPLDPSQTAALKASRTEKALVIDGPPGTGKSQVILAILLDALSRGLKVAVVSDKRAALDVIAQRLSANGFGDIYGIIHDVYKDRNTLFSRIAERMKAAAMPPIPSADPEGTQKRFEIFQNIHREIATRHQTLCRLDDTTHLSVHGLLQYLSALQIQLLHTPHHSPHSDQLIREYLKSSDLKLPSLRPEALSNDALAQIASIPVHNLQKLNEIIVRFMPYTALLHTQAWWHKDLSDPEFAAHITSFSQFLISVQKDIYKLQSTLSESHAPHPNATSDLARVADIWKSFYQMLQQSPELSIENLSSPWQSLLTSVIELETIQHFKIFRPSYWKNKKEITRWLLTHAPEFSQLKLDDTSLHMLHERANANIQALNKLAPCQNLPDLGIDLLHKDLTRNMDTAISLNRLLNDCPRDLYCAYDFVSAECKAPSFSPSTDPAEILPIWQLRALQIWAEEHLKAIRADLGSLQPRTSFGTMQETAEKLSSLEAELRALNSQSLRETLLTRGILSEPRPKPRARRTPAQKIIEAIYEEASKKTRHKTLRCFVREFADSGLLDILPVWLLSPETMTVLFPRKPVFDLVIIDEASQSTVASALPTLMRTRQWIIAGDDKQMPPSTFFTASNKTSDTKTEISESDHSSDIFDSESLLTLARQRVPHTRLSWHYRSQHDALIAFSNFAFYDGELMTVPAMCDEMAPNGLVADDPRRYLRWIHVEDAVYESGVNRKEAARAAQILHDSLRNCPEESVGIITFNTSQRDAVLDAIDALRAADPSFSQLYDAACQLPMDRRPFVKSIENVQGDERDSIFFSLGHCAVPRKGRAGSELRVPARFGPLGQKGGERRLNVAISRARLKSTIISSFLPEQLSVGNVKNAGPAYFKLFIEFMWAASHDDPVNMNIKLREARQLNTVIGRDTCDPSHRNALPRAISLTAQIASTAETLGYHTEKDIGISQFKIPLVLQYQTQAPIAVLIETDGPEEGYDLLLHRPAMLAQKGWRVLQLNAFEWHTHGEEILKQYIEVGEYHYLIFNYRII